VQEWCKCGPALLILERNNIKRGSEFDLFGIRHPGAKGVSVASALLVLEHNIKKDRAFDIY